MSRKFRETNACRECRRRKVKCDTARPLCTTCRERGVECSYADFANDALSHLNQLDAAGVFSPQPTGSFVYPAARQQDRSADVSTGVNASIAQGVPRRRISTSQIQLSPGSEIEESVPKRPREHGDQSPIEQQVGGDIGFLDIEGGGRARYVAGNHWACVSTEPEQIDRLLRSQKRYDGGENWPQQSSNQSVSTSPQFTSDHSYASVGSRGAPETRAALRRVPASWSSEASGTSKFQSHAVIDLDAFPTRPQADCLVHAFIRNYQAIIPLVHVPSFLNACDQFWKAGGGEAPKTHPSPPFVSLLYAVLLAGSVTVSDHNWASVFPEQSREDVSQELYAQTSQTLRRASHLRTPAIDSFTAYLISESIWLRDEEPLKCCSFIGIAVRIAQILGLNRDPSHFSAILPVAAEVRRRVWWYIFHLDIQVSLAAGLPPLIESTSWDVRPISELKDRYIGSPEAKGYEDALASTSNHPVSAQDEQIHATSLVSTSGLYAAGKYRDTVCSKVILLTLFQQKQKTRSDVTRVRFEIEQLRSNLTARIRRIPIGPISSNIDGEHQIESYAYHPILNRWARLVLAALCDKTWGYLYHPLVHTAISRVWAPLRSSILYHSQEFVRKCVSMAINPDFQPFHWTWPGQHQPLHALMILIREIDINAYLPGAEEYRETVDEAFALCGPSGGLMGTEDPKLHRQNLTEVGREAWDLLYRLRSRAWQKHGVDPDILWTRDQVADMAHAKAVSMLNDPRAGYPHGETSDQHILESDRTSSHSLNPDVFDSALHIPPTQSPMMNETAMNAVDWSEWDSLVAGSQSDMPGYLGFDLNADQ